MAVVGVIEVRPDGDLESLRRRLGNTGHVRRAMGDVLDETARLGAQIAESESPRGRGGLIARAISSQHATMQTSGAIQAAVGVKSVSVLAGGRSGPLRDKQSDYPFFVHEGTGVFGKFHRRITPVRARAMRFIGRSGLVYALSVAGQRPNPYIGRAYEEIQAYIPQRLDEMVHRILDRDV